MGRFERYLVLAPSDDNGNWQLLLGTAGGEVSVIAAANGTQGLSAIDAAP